MVGLKLAIPAAMVVLGGSAMVVAASAGDEPTRSATPQVWIDGPAGVAPLDPGSIPVTAHATASGAIDALVLYVDGNEVATDDDLARSEKLVVGEFGWDAEPGVHELVVEQRGGSTARSSVRTVVVAGGASPTSAPATTTTTSAPTSTTVVDATTTTTGSTTTTSSPEAAPPVTIAPPEVGDTTPVTIAPPTTTTSPPAAPPFIAAATIASTNQNRLYVGACGYTLTVRARVTDAERVQVQVEGTGFDRPMARSGASWSLTIGSGPSVWSGADLGTHRVVVVARGPGGEVRQVAGTLTVIDRCPKD